MTAARGCSWLRGHEMPSVSGDNSLSRLAVGLMATERRMLAVEGAITPRLVYPVGDKHYHIPLTFQAFVDETQGLREPEKRQALFQSLGFGFYSTAVMIHEMLGRRESVRDVRANWLQTVLGLLRHEAPPRFAVFGESSAPVFAQIGERLVGHAVVSIALNRLNIAGVTARIILNRSRCPVRMETPRPLSTADAWRMCAELFRGVYGPGLS